MTESPFSLSDYLYLKKFHIWVYKCTLHRHSCHYKLQIYLYSTCSTLSSCFFPSFVVFSNEGKKVFSSLETEDEASFLKTMCRIAYSRFIFSDLKRKSRKRIGSFINDYVCSSHSQCGIRNRGQRDKKDGFLENFKKKKLFFTLSKVFFTFCKNEVNAYHLSCTGKYSFVCICRLALDKSIST